MNIRDFMKSDFVSFEKKINQQVTELCDTVLNRAIENVNKASQDFVD